MVALGRRSSIIAHRGASGKAPENTLSAFASAWTKGATAIELDVRLTKDGKIVAMHDASTGRTGNKDVRVSEVDYADLQDIDAGQWKGRKWAGERIPLLEEVLIGVPHHGRVFIELKCGAEILPVLRQVLESSPLAMRQICLIGFDFELMATTKVEFPDIEVCWISRPKKHSKGLSPTSEELIEKAVSANLDGLDLHKSFAFTEDFVNHIQAAGLALYVWTVDSGRMARRFENLGIDGITTNRPGKIDRAIRKMGFFRKVSLAIAQVTPAPLQPASASGIHMPLTSGLLGQQRNALSITAASAERNTTHPPSRPRFTSPCPDQKPPCPSSSSKEQAHSRQTFVTSISDAIQKSWSRSKSGM